METIYFSLGIVTALVAVLLVIGVVMVVRLTKKQSNQEKTINCIERYNQEGRNELVRDLDEIRREICNQFEEIHRMVIQLNDEVRRELENKNQEAHRHVDELNRYVDSRFDKILNKINNSSNDPKDLLTD